MIPFYLYALKNKGYESISISSLVMSGMLELCPNVIINLTATGRHSRISHLALQMPASAHPLFFLRCSASRQGFINSCLICTANVV